MSPENHVSSTLKKAQILRERSLTLPTRGAATAPYFLEKNKLIHVDRDDERFGRGMAVRLETEDPMLRRKDDARELLEIGDVVSGPYTAADLDVVVVPLQQSFLIEVQHLLCTVGRYMRGEVDVQTTPRFACFLPG